MLDWIIKIIYFIGGKQKKSRPGYYKNAAGETIIQSFVFEDGPFKGQAKGLKVYLHTTYFKHLCWIQVICQERFGSEAIKKKKHCDLGIDNNISPKCYHWVI